MANFAFNIAKGRMAEFFNRVDQNDPTNSAIIAVPMSASGTEAQGQDLATLAAVEADANFAERTSGSWVRKVLTDADIAAIAADNTNNRMPCTIPQITFTTPATGNDTTGILFCYDSDTTGGTDSNIIPLVHLTFAVTTSGNDVIINAGDVCRSS